MAARVPRTAPLIGDAMIISASPFAGISLELLADLERLILLRFC